MTTDSAIVEPTLKSRPNNSGILEPNSLFKNVNLVAKRFLHVIADI